MIYGGRATKKSRVCGRRCPPSPPCWREPEASGKEVLVDLNPAPSTLAPQKPVAGRGGVEARLGAPHPVLARRAPGGDFGHPRSRQGAGLGDRVICRDLGEWPREESNLRLQIQSLALLDRAEQPLAKAYHHTEHRNWTLSAVMNSYPSSYQFPLRRPSKRSRRYSSPVMRGSWFHDGWVLVGVQVPTPTT